VLILRIAVIVVAIAIGISIAVFAVSGDRRYLRLAWQLFKYSVFGIVLVLGLMFFERLVVLL
jgi:heme O synthase-like polyprenyltransferase